MDKKTRKHSICEKVPYIAIILSILFPSLLAGIGLLYEFIVVVTIGIIALYLISKNKFAKANEIWEKKWISER